MNCPNSKTKFCLTAVFAFGVASTSLAQTLEYTTLQTRRPQLQLPALSPQEIDTLLSQAELTLGELYVNRDLKLRDFGSGVDHVQALATLRTEASRLSSSEFHQRMSLIFNRYRDLHTSYRLPVPYSCFRTLLPFAVTQTVDTEGRSQITVGGIRNDPSILQLVPALSQVSTGDIVVKFAGLSALEALQGVYPMSRGANPAAQHRRALETLTYRSQSLHQIPAEDTVELLLQSQFDGRQYTLTVPWLSRLMSGCLPTAGQPSTNSVSSLKDELLVGVDQEQLEYERFYRSRIPARPRSRAPGMPGSGVYEATQEPTLRWKIVTSSGGRFGVLRLSSFSPERVKGEGTIELIIDLLRNELAGTDGLIIDIRDNGGGLIHYGQSLAQLFTPQDIAPLTFKLLNSPLNRHVFETVFARFSNPFRDALRVAESRGERYTTDLLLSPPPAINDRGQFYFRPVAIFTNGSCYSTCDMFSALMQDFGIARIFGQDAQTGAGGANNTDTAALYNSLPADRKDRLALLPLGQVMGFAWRQTVRSGQRRGQLLENAGVYVDEVLVPTHDDIMREDVTQFEKIGRYLQSIARPISSIKIDVRRQVDIQGPNLVLPITLQGTASVSVVAANQTLTFDLPNSDPQILTVQIPASNLLGDIGPLSLFGFSSTGAGQQRVWRRFLNYRKVPNHTVVAPGSSLDWDFRQDTGPLKVYTLNSSQGWYVDNGRLLVGGPSGYSHSMNTQAVLFADLTQRTGNLTLEFDAEVNTEPRFDFFSVQAVQNENIVDLLAPISGVSPRRRYQIDLTPYVGRRAEFRLSFTSNSSESGAGVIITNMSLR